MINFQEFRKLGIGGSDIGAIVGVSPYKTALDVFHEKIDEKANNDDNLAKASWHLRRTRAMRRSRHHTQKTADHGRITDTVSISERPASVEDRAVPGHWEGDLICGTKNSYIATLVERHTRYVMLAKVGRSDTETVINAVIKQAHKLPRELYKSLTWDRGKEMADH